MVAYFKKTQPNNPVMVAGRALRFDLLQTENPEVVTALRLAARRGVGGVLEIDAAAFEAETLKKKNSQPSLIRPPVREEYGRMPSPTRLSRNGAAASAVAGPQSADKVAPKPGHIELVLPTIGRVTDL